MKLKFLVIFALITLLPMVSYSTEGLLKEPWDDKPFPEQSKPISSSQESSFHGFFKSPLKYSLTSAVKFYQYAISPVIGSRCSMYPSCSNYSLLVIKKHGGLIGFAMTVDRLMHEAEELRSGPLIEEDNGRYLVYDPVENNDFWWSEKEEK